MRPQYLLFLFGLLGIVACARRPLPVEPLAGRVVAYHPPARPELTVLLPSRLAPLPKSATASTAPSPAEASHRRYEQAYQELTKMLDGRYPLSFKRAVFLTKNAYLGEELRYDTFCDAINALVRVCRTVQAGSRDYLLYDRPDKAEVLRNAVLFKVLTEPTTFNSGRVQQPFGYDFEDFNGETEWRQMFVTKLLVTNRGNCHSLPFLYKILADETGARAWLALAPNHIYLKQHNEKDGWYNTELTSRTFPNDAWLTASGYISKQTIVSGIYMDTLSTRQSVALCLVDLAKGYERQLGRAAGADFALRCTDLALQYFPQCINAQLLRAEALRQRFERQSNAADAQQAFATLEAAYTGIYQTGYREIPPRLYADWLRLVQKEKAKYLNPAKH